MTRKNYLAGLFLTVGLSLSMAACKDTKTLQANEQLKAQVAELQKQNGELGNRVEAATSASDAMARENEELKKEINSRRAVRPSSKPAAKRRRRIVRKSRRR